MNKIDRELKDSHKYYLEYDENGLIRLSKDNVARVEAMIHFNSSYSEAFNKEKEGSSAYYFMKLKEILLNKKKVSDSKYKQSVKDVVSAIDRENSTHLNSDGSGINTITNRICDITKPTLVKYLRDPAGTKYKLFNILAEKTRPRGKSENGNKRNGRENPSFASKFCHYACFYMFEGEKEQDNYSIYDSVIRKALPKYMEAYGISDRDLSNYEEYQQTIDEIIRKSKSGISRNGFDHLIWYCYKVID